MVGQNERKKLSDKGAGKPTGLTSLLSRHLIVSILLLSGLIPIFASCKIGLNKTNPSNQDSNKAVITRSKQTSQYPDPNSQRWFDDANLQNILNIDYFNLTWTYDPSAALQDGVTLVGWGFIEDLEGTDGFNYTFSSTRNLDFDNDLSFGEKVQLLSSRMRVLNPDGTYGEDYYSPTSMLLSRIYHYWKQNGALPQSVTDLDPSLNDPQVLQAMWDSLQATNYGVLDVLLWDKGPYFHHGCGTLMKLDTSGQHVACGMTIRIVQDPDLRQFAVWTATHDWDLAFGGNDNSDWFILYYRIYGSTPDKVIQEEIFVLSPSDQALLDGQNNSSQRASGPGTTSESSSSTTNKSGPKNLGS